MGFHSGAYARVWEVSPSSDACTKVRMSINRKNRMTEEYETDFSGYVLVLGSAAAQKAMGLHEGSRIKIGDCDVTTKYDKERKITYTNYKMFSFEDAEFDGSQTRSTTAPQPVVDEGEFDESRLPF